MPILLGSATPALESLHNAQAGRYGLLRLTQRAGGAHPPKFIRLDVKSMPLDAGLSRPLQQAIGDTLAAGQQVLVFLNRRGFAPTLLCHDCGWISQCPRCDARMTVHQGSGELRCHHCDHRQRPPMNCPQCGKLDLRPLGAGTERAEERLRILFPNHPVLRIDRDSTHASTPCATSSPPSTAVSHASWSAPRCSPRHHFPRVTLVAILDADGGLFSADFRASERMAQQIVQVAGRAGRAEEPGRVLIQTHLADHPLLVQLTEDGYFAFAEQALSERRAAGLPLSPTSPCCAPKRTSRARRKPSSTAPAVPPSNCSSRWADRRWNCSPVPAPMERRAGKHRAQLLLQCMSRAPLHRLLTPWLQSLEQLPGGRQVRWSLDIDPIDLF